MDEIISDVVDGIVDPGLDDALIDLATGRRSSKGKEPPFLSVIMVICLVLLAMSVSLHFVNAGQSRFTRLTFNETTDGLQAEILVERQVAELENLFNIPDSISGPTPALKIQEHQADSGSPRMREVSYRIVESAAGLPLRSRVISVEEPHEDSGLRDFLRLIPDDRVNAYLVAAAVELEAKGFPELADATRSGSTQVISIDHSMFGTSYAIWSWILAGIVIILLPVQIRAIIVKRM